MTSRKRSARKREQDRFEAGLSESLDDVFARADAQRVAAEAHREEMRRVKSCTSKNRYDTRQEALAAISWCAEHGRSGLSCYRCDFCGGWHLTSHPWE